jgi:hypothetical protein
MRCLVCCLLAQAPMDKAADAVGGKNNLLLYGGIAAGVLVLLLLVLVLLRRGRGASPEAGLGEDLASYPPPPKTRGDCELTVMNQPGRLRLAVVAPVGKKKLPAVEAVLDEVLRNLGDVAGEDKARLRTWPAQLSSKGFAPTFFRLIRRPEPEGRASRWVLLAGPARAGAVPVLVGLAVLLDEPSKLGLMTLDELEWNEVLRVSGA